MRLSAIKLAGFKSFVDPTSFQAPTNLTGIVGPNGCGKSNVVDAVRWVLGEQSPKQLRGGKMDDVIFKGTTKRRPVGMAEVTITFTNDDGRLPVEYEEVAIKRRVTRDGTSDYFLNGSLCRLKDLRDLLWDTGVNNTSYSIIEESMIKQILNENNQELRKLLEEGSGITKYKARRKETQRKLDRTQADLTRLYDIIDEIGREVKQHLINRANAGVRVYFLYDEIGSHDLPSAYKDELRAAGVEVYDFHTQKGPGNRFQINFRNHRKVVVVDGKVAWVGGHNVGDEYLGRDPKFGHWRDTHVRIEGPAALGAQAAGRGVERSRSKHRSRSR